MIADYKELEDRIRGMTVLIVGGAPSASNLTAKQYNEYDVIIRINNFKYANECKRTDYWFSYFGNNIKRVEERIQEENIKNIICKYPINEEFGWTHELRKTIWTQDLNVFIPTEKESFQTNNLYKISPTAGLACIIAVLRGKPSLLRIIGFDFFETKVHNLDEKWDESGGHEMIKEKGIVTMLVNSGEIEWLK